jgi:hypothetical protein
MPVVWCIKRSSHDRFQERDKVRMGETVTVKKVWSKPISGFLQDQPWKETYCTFKEKSGRFDLYFFQTADAAAP